MKIVFIGAGSTVFAKNLIGDLLLNEELKISEFALVDIDSERLETTAKVAAFLIKHFKKNIQVTTHLERKNALKDAHFVLLMFQIGGYKPCTLTDFQIPKKYGLRHTIADTLGVGGIMRALRTLPVVFEICKEIETLCPDAFLLNYVNPMAMISLAVQKEFPEIQYVGLCHSVQGTARELAKDLGRDFSRINYFCAGINHMAFYLRFEEILPDGKRNDLYPELFKLAAEGKFPRDNSVRYDILNKFNFFVTESSEHFSEYVPWYIKESQPESIKNFHIPLDEYIKRCEDQIKDWKTMKKNFEAGKFELPEGRSIEYASDIIHAYYTGKPAMIYGNVINNYLIENLPKECSVEVPCVVDSNGIQPVDIGALPPQLASLMLTNINVQTLTVEAFITENKEHVYHAAYLDPHTSAELNLDQIDNLVDDLIAAHKTWLPKFIRND